MLVHSNDAGVGALIADAPAEGESVAVDITVNGAVVTNLGYAPEGVSPNTFISDGFLIIVLCCQNRDKYSGYGVDMLVMWTVLHTCLV